MPPLPLPDFNFGERPDPDPPDYGDLASWSAHPDLPRCATNDFIPAGDAPPPLSDRPCDCFFLCGTNFIGTASWNAPVPNACSDEWCDVDVVSQGSALNSRCRIFAPRYRQNSPPCHSELMHPNAPEERQRSAYAAMDLSYGDVERAFEHFLERTGGSRPIIVASHSQGSQHATRLLERFHQDPELRERLVCAYILGPCCTFARDKFERCFPSLHPSSGPLDAQCVVAFDHLSSGERQVWMEGLDQELGENDEPRPEDGFPVRNMGSDPPHNVRYPDGWASARGRPIFCTNPLTWTSELGRADGARYLGRAVVSVKTDAGTDGNFDDCIAGKATGVRVTGIEKADEGVHWAEIAYDGGVLLQPQPGEPFRHMEWEYWYFNVRENAGKRVNAWLAKREGV